MYRHIMTLTSKELQKYSQHKFAKISFFKVDTYISLRRIIITRIKRNLCFSWMFESNIVVGITRLRYPCNLPLRLEKIEDVLALI